MDDILFLAPVFKERIWGGTKLKELYSYDIPSAKTGECWAISAHPEGESVVLNGSMTGLPLSQVYKDHPEMFFGCHEDKFPLLTKIIDANQDLSVQVHPDDLYASKYTRDAGKTECWYVLFAKENAQMVFGHKALTKEEFVKKVSLNQWDDLLMKRPVKTGDFIYVPAGTIHALCQGTVVLETQQSSDTTYRLYDYDRLDQNGNKRQLHLKESIEVSTIPHKEENLITKITSSGNNTCTQFVKTDYFTVEKWDIADYVKIINQRFYLVSVIEGQGFINNIPIQKGQHFIITSLTKSIELTGCLSLIVSMK